MMLVAGIGNIFFGDDGFGVEVARRLESEPLPPGTTVADFGIRSVHLAYELLSAPRLVVLVDCVPRGGVPGTLHVIEPETDGAEAASQADPHGMHLPAVFAQVRALGGAVPKTRIVGCEPALLDEHIGLSEPVRRAIEPAVGMIRRLLQQEVQEPWTEV